MLSQVDERRNPRTSAPLDQLLDRAGLEGYGLTISERLPLPVRVGPENLRYLTTKRDRMGHEMPDLGSGEGVVSRRSLADGTGL